MGSKSSCVVVEECDVMEDRLSRALRDLADSLDEVQAAAAKVTCYQSPRGSETASLSSWSRVSRPASSTGNPGRPQARLWSHEALASLIVVITFVISS